MKTNIYTKMKGFTLIELLVVITIIGILATIVIVNLNSTRGRSQDAAIKEQMAQIRSILAIYYSDHYGYTTSTQGAISSQLCSAFSGGTTAFGDADFQKSVVGVLRNSAVAPTCALGSNSGGPSQSWVMFTKMRVNSTDYWCVDSSGASQQVSSNTYVSTTNGAIVDVSCPAS